MFTWVHYIYGNIYQDQPSCLASAVVQKHMLRLGCLEKGGNRHFVEVADIMQRVPVRGITQNQDVVAAINFKTPHLLRQMSAVG